MFSIFEGTMLMPVTRAVVLVLDRLGASWLGPYGNTWLDTPNFNRLAAQATLFETTLAESPDLSSYYRSVWTGRHALHAAGDVATPSAVKLPGTHSVFMTDDGAVFEHPLTASFTERFRLPTADTDASAEHIEETGLYQFFAAARSQLEHSSHADLLWLHARAMAGPWDAPLELRYQFADEEDPEPPSLVGPPHQVLPANDDPDLLLGYSQAYAGQVTLADMCLGMLLDALDEHPARNETMLLVTSSRGYPLGEHCRVGDAEPALYGELLQIPLLVRVPGLDPARERRLLQPSQLRKILASAFAGLADLASEPLASAAYATAHRQRAIRTPAWFLRESQDDRDQPAYELFAKPDDRWEANEIASRCGAAVELLAAELARFAAVEPATDVAQTAPLAELLCDIWR